HGGSARAPDLGRDRAASARAAPDIPRVLCPPARRSWPVPLTAWRALVTLGLLALFGTPGWGQGTWTRAAPLLESRSEVTGAELGGRLYVIGGFGHGGDVVEAYDPRTDRWERRAPVPVGLNHAAAVSVGGRLYVIG